MHISEIEDPTPWLSGGELLLTTGMQLDTRRSASARSSRGWPTTTWPGSASGPASPMPRSRRRCVEAAAEREFPVFEVPYDVPFIALTEAAFTQLVNEQYAVLRRALAAHERLERVVLSERGLDALAIALSTLIGAAVLVCDARGKPLARKEAPAPLEPDAIAALRRGAAQRAGAGARRLPRRGELADRSLALPVAPTPGAGGECDGRGAPRRGWSRSRTGAAV